MNLLIEVAKKVVADARNDERSQARGVDTIEELVVTEGLIYELEGALHEMGVLDRDEKILQE